MRQIPILALFRTVNADNQGGFVLYGATTSYNSSTLAYNSLFGDNLSWLGYYVSSSLSSTITPASSSNLSLQTSLFTISSLPMGVYSCSGALRLYASAGSSIIACIVQAVQNNNTAIIPFIWNDNFDNGSTLGSNLNFILPVNFKFYNNTTSGSLVLQITAYYDGTMQVLGPQTTYLQLTRIA